MNIRNLLWVLGLLCVVVITVVVAWPDNQSGSKQTSQSCVDDSKQTSRPDEGYCAPNFQLPDQTGKMQELYANQGKPTLINFWATWCDPCLSELPYLEAAYRKYHDQVNFWMVNATSTEPNEQAVTKFMHKNRYTFPVLLDRRETNIAFGKYKLVGLPITIGVDRQGKIVFKHVGSINQTELNQAMDKLMD